MKTLLAPVAILAATIAMTAPAAAGCSCQCVNGQMEANEVREANADLIARLSPKHRERAEAILNGEVE
jgi:hypothetical protein